MLDYIGMLIMLMFVVGMFADSVHHSKKKDE